MNAASLQVELPCTCGRTITAEARDAGCKIVCKCGDSVDVPLLSRLRQLAGKDAYITNPADAIRKMLQFGKNPAGNGCIACRAASPTEYKCLVVCESPSLKGAPAAAANDILRRLLQFVGKVLFGLASILVARLAFVGQIGDEDEEVVGNEVHVTVPLPVCDSCNKALGDATRPKVARKLMATVPAYADLLAFYPNAELHISRQ